VIAEFGRNRLKTFSNRLISRWQSLSAARIGTLPIGMTKPD